MRKRGLAIAALVCGIAWTVLIGAGALPDGANTGLSEPMSAAAIAGEAENASEDDSESTQGDAVETAEGQAAKRTEEQQSEAEAATVEGREQAERSDDFDGYCYEPETHCEPIANESSETCAEPEEPSVKTCVIIVDGVEMGYVYCFGAAEAPWTGAGVWEGSDSTTDESFGYFIGHNPGSFWPVASIGMGGEVVVHDSTGASRAYHVIDSFIVPVGSTWSDVYNRISGYGESVVLQTCVESGYRIVICQ